MVKRICSRVSMEPPSFVPIRLGFTNRMVSDVISDCLVRTFFPAKYGDPFIFRRDQTLFDCCLMLFLQHTKRLLTSRYSIIGGAFFLVSPDRKTIVHPSHNNPNVDNLLTTFVIQVVCESHSLLDKVQKTW